MKWDISREDHDLIVSITERFLALTSRNYLRPMPKREVIMDLTACHANGCRLALVKLNQAQALDLIHDVFGIRHHLDRKTGELKDCFQPRYAEVNHS